MTLDSQGHLHIAFYANDRIGVPQSQHVCNNSQQWQHSYATQRKTPVTLNGDTLKTLIFRLKNVIDRQDTGHLIYRAQETDHKLVVACSSALVHLLKEDQFLVLHDESVGYAELVVDHLRLEKERSLSQFSQSS